MNNVTEDPAAEEVLFERPRYRIRLAGNRRGVGHLLERMYRWRGYKADGLATPPGTINQITLEALSDGHTVGTITVGLDSPTKLQAEGLYKEEIEQYRRRGARVCEFIKLAVAPDSNCQKVLAPLFQIAHIYAHRIHRATDLFVEVNPRHAVFYRRLLGFAQAGVEKICPRVNAPAVLLHLDLKYAAQQILARGETQKSPRSFYRNAFSSQEADVLRRKMEAIGLTRPFGAASARAVRQPHTGEHSHAGFLPMLAVPDAEFARVIA
jgi:hypothetical protein